ncbi:hypothetical protein PspLS_08846 [Pyricularia sp. CBS 133598]|nr:hypothetical protein PspLS_08846 [Pyricularia sp. CBS 133598]
MYCVSQKSPPLHPHAFYSSRFDRQISGVGSLFFWIATGRYSFKAYGIRSKFDINSAWYYHQLLCHLHIYQRRGTLNLPLFHRATLPLMLELVVLRDNQYSPVREHSSYSYGYTAFAYLASWIDSNVLGTHANARYSFII